MSEAFGLCLVVGLAAMLVGISMLTAQCERQTRSALEAVIGRVIARLQEVSKAPGLPRIPPPASAGSPERRSIPRRRLEDNFLSRRLSLRHLAG